MGDYYDQARALEDIRILTKRALSDQRKPQLTEKAREANVKEARDTIAEATDEMRKNANYGVRTEAQAKARVDYLLSVSDPRTTDAFSSAVEKARRTGCTNREILDTFTKA